VFSKQITLLYIYKKYFKKSYQKCKTPSGFQGAEEGGGGEGKGGGGGNIMADGTVSGTVSNDACINQFE
jgi:hypothetical protein